MKRGVGGWRDDIRFFLNDFLSKFSEHRLIRRLDFSEVSLPITHENQFIKWLTHFGFVSSLKLYGGMNLAVHAMNSELPEEPLFE